MVERYQRQISEQSAPNAFMRNHVDGAATGVQVGNAVAGFGNEVQRFAEIQKRRNDEYDATRVMEAQNEYNRAMSDWMDNPETGKTNTRKLGLSKGVSDEAFRYGDELALKIADTLDNDAQRGAFLRVAQRAKLPYWKQASEFEVRQTKAYSDQVFRTTLEQGGMAVQRAPLDSTAFETAAQQGANAIRSQFYGADESVINAAIEEYTSGLEQQRIAIIAAEDPVVALSMVEESPYLTPGTTAAMKKNLGAEVERLEEKAARELEKEQYYATVDSLWKQYGDDEQAAYDALFSDPTKDREAKEREWSGYKSRVYDQKRMEAEVDREYMSAWQDKIADSKSMEEAMQFIQESGATGHQHRQLEGYASQIHGRSQKESLEDWTLAQKEVREEKFKSEQDLIYRWGGILSDETMRGLLRTYWSSADKNADGSGKYAKYVGYDFNKDVEQAKKDLKIREGTPQERVFVTELGDEIFAQEQKLGRHLTPAERGAVLDGLKKRRILNPGILIDDTMPAYEVQRAESMGFQRNDALEGYYRERPDGSFEKYVSGGTVLPADKSVPTAPAPPVQETPSATAEADTENDVSEEEISPAWTTPQSQTTRMRSEDTALQAPEQAPAVPPPDSAPRQKRMPDGRVIGEKSRRNNAPQQKQISGSGKDFVEEITPDVVEVADSLEIPPSVLMAQAILESNWGKSRVGNNLFGVKAGKNWQGKTREATTHEESGGKMYKTKATFRDYDSAGESIRDLGRVLSNKRYAAVRGAPNYRAAAQALQQAGYATDSRYAAKLIGIIEKHRLYELDNLPA